MNRGVSLLRSAPFIRLIIPFICGIIFQYYLMVSIVTLALIFSGALTCLLFIRFLPLFHRFRFKIGMGIVIFILFASFGALIVAAKDVRSQPDWLGHNYSAEDSIVLTLTEDLSEKANSYKALASPAILLNGNIRSVNGKVIIYFKKHSIFLDLHEGSMLMIRKPLQVIRNSGNPGGFDYRRYCEFQDISHQVYLTEKDFLVLKNENSSAFRSFIASVRKKVLEILSTHINGKKELGLAEALLIGYKDDLDKELVQSYSNTGVVHVIAISGLHLGLIYGLMVVLLKPFRKNKKLKLLGAVITIIILWMFSIVAGAQASVLRSALMFTCIVIGENISRQSNIYNTLSFSAFVLLCYHPFWLWDAGFQLSYAAVLSIIIFMKPVYDLLYIRNKILDAVWKLNAVTIAAQILTLPFMLYHFHQFPAGFLLSNLIAVPLSSLILIGEIILCIFSFIPIVAYCIGVIVTILIKGMNDFIQKIDAVPGTVWDLISTDVWQSVLIIIVIGALSIWSLTKRYLHLLIAMMAILFIVLLRSLSFISCRQQQVLIVYNIPKTTSIDVLTGHSFIHLSDVPINDQVFRFHMRPSRIKHRSYYPVVICNVGDTSVLIRSGTHTTGVMGKHILAADVLIVTQNSDTSMVTEEHTPSLVVLSPALTFRKTAEWLVKCRELNIRCHDIKEKGAFVMNLDKRQETRYKRQINLK